MILHVLYLIISFTFSLFLMAADGDSYPLRGKGFNPEYIVFETGDNLEADDANGELFQLGSWKSLEPHPPAPAPESTTLSAPFTPPNSTTPPTKRKINTPHKSPEKFNSHPDLTDKQIEVIEKEMGYIFKIVRNNQYENLRGTNNRFAHGVLNKVSEIYFNFLNISNDFLIDFTRAFEEQASERTFRKITIQGNLFDVGNEKKARDPDRLLELVEAIKNNPNIKMETLEIVIPSPEQIDAHQKCLFSLIAGSVAEIWKNKTKNTLRNIVFMAPFNNRGWAGLALGISSAVFAKDAVSKSPSFEITNTLPYDGASDEFFLYLEKPEQLELKCTYINKKNIQCTYTNPKKKRL